MKPIPLIVIGSSQAHACVRSINDWCPCITASCGTGGGHTPMIVEIINEDNLQGESDRTL